MTKPTDALPADRPAMQRVPLALVLTIGGMFLLGVAAGVLVKGSPSQIDLLLVGALPTARVKALIKDLEKQESRELNYAVLNYDEFYYRLSVRDKFITEVLGGKHAVLYDAENILKQ